MRHPQTLLALLCVAALAACTQMPSPMHTPAPAPASADDAAADATRARLSGHVWHLREARSAEGARIDALLDTPGQPLALRFDEGRIALLNGCNQMGGSVGVQPGALDIGPLASTLMACPDPRLMDFDRAAADAMKGRLAMQTSDGTPPTLTLTNQAGDVLRFEGEPTAETRYGGPGQRMFLEVAAQTQPCPHPLMRDMQCLQVRELQYDTQGLRTGTPGAFGNFYDSIKGYQHVPGTRNVLRIKRYDVPNPPADASRYAWVLDAVIESETVPATQR